MRTEHVERLNRAQEIEDAARKLLDALKASRTPYRQTARNAPSAEQVRASKRQRLAEAENRLHDLLGGDDG